jgi:2',3'-cyclic-nucleotide 2'-phosphodiesterase
MIGDVVGDPGMEVLESRLPVLIKENSADFVVVNGENAAGGFGLTADLLKRIIVAGADLVTSGNHIWEKREFWPALESEERVLRPMNYPEGSLGLKTASGTADRLVGKGWAKLEKPSPWGQITWLTVNLQGREFMKAIDCPFKAFDTLETIANATCAEKPIILVDFHAESSREKESLAYYLDGRASLIAGTHTHVQTADERLLPKGSAYITDLGMTGTLDGIIGMDTKICLDRARNQVLYRMEVAGASSEGKTAVQGVIVEIDAESRKALSIKRL